MDSSSDISIIDELIWRKTGRPKLTDTNKIARGIAGKTLKFKDELKCNVSFCDKTFRSNVYVHKGNNSCLFGIDRIVLFNLWELPVNSFCNQMNTWEKKKLKQTEKFMRDLKDELSFL